jgi:inner membrane transporter RhtA
MVLLGIASVHCGAAIAKSLFTQISPIGMTTLRLTLGAIIMVSATRPQWRQYDRESYQLLAALGISVGLMNILFYQAIAQIPIGVGVTLEFVGPLGVALAHSKRRWDRVWVGMAALGILLLAPIGSLAINPLGVVLALAARAFGVSTFCWRPG